MTNRCSVEVEPRGYEFDIWLSGPDIKADGIYDIALKYKKAELRIVGVEIYVGNDYVAKMRKRRLWDPEIAYYECAPGCLSDITSMYYFCFCTKSPLRIRCYLDNPARSPCRVEVSWQSAKIPPARLQALRGDDSRILVPFVNDTGAVNYIVYQQGRATRKFEI